MPKQRPSTEYPHHEKFVPVPGQRLIPDKTQPVLSTSNQASKLSSEGHDSSFQLSLNIVNLPRIPLPADRHCSFPSTVTDAADLQSSSELQKDLPNDLSRVHEEGRFWMSSSPQELLHHSDIGVISEFTGPDHHIISLRPDDHRQVHDITRCLAQYSDAHSTASDRFDFEAEEVLHESKITSSRGDRYLDRSSLPETDQIVNDLEDCFDDGIDDDDLLRLMCSTPVSVRGNEENSPYRLDYDFVFSERAAPAKGTAQKFISPVTSLTQIRTKESIAAEKRTPIVRVPFPTQVRDRSPVIGLSPARVLRTCFRIGEAINAGRDAVKNNKEVLLELYARVVESVRADHKQTFVFCDLFHTKPPYIKAEYPSTIWQACNLHEVDSGRLLVGNRMCRCIGIMRKEDMEWKLQVLNIWECTWEDIEWVEAIVNA